MASPDRPAGWVGTPVMHTPPCVWNDPAYPGAMGRRRGGAAHIVYVGISHPERRKYPTYIDGRFYGTLIEAVKAKRAAAVGL